MTASERIDYITDILLFDFEYCTITRPKTGSDNAIDEPTYTDKELHWLDYDAKTVAFTVGETVTGGTSGATGVLVYDWQHPRLATKGRLLLRRDSDTTAYQDDETLTGSSTGSATANGANSDEFKCSIDIAGVSPYALINNMRNVVPGGLLEQSSHIITFNIREALGLQAGDTVTDENGDEYFLLNVQDHQTWVTCLAQKG